MYKDTVTVFNRYGSRVNGDTWYAHCLYNTDVNIDRAAIIAKYGENAAESAKLHIMIDGDGTIQGLRFLDPVEWNSLTNDELSSAITFQNGQNFDFFYVGEWDGPDVIRDDDYADGFYDFMNRNHSKVYAVTTVGIYSIIPHVEILGK